MQWSSLHFPGPPNVTVNKAVKGGSAWHAGFAGHLEELLQDTYGAFTYSKWALGMYCAYCWWETREAQWDVLYKTQLGLPSPVVRH